MSAVNDKVSVLETDIGSTNMKLTTTVTSQSVDK